MKNPLILHQDEFNQQNIVGLFFIKNEDLYQHIKKKYTFVTEINTNQKSNILMLQRFKSISLTIAIVAVCSFTTANAKEIPAPTSKSGVVQNNERALPAHSTIYISSKYALQLIEVYDEQGNLFEKIPLQATTWYALDIKKWPLGIYTIKVENNVSNVKRKILKVR